MEWNARVRWVRAHMRGLRLAHSAHKHIIWLVVIVVINIIHTSKVDIGSQHACSETHSTFCYIMLLDGRRRAHVCVHMCICVDVCLCASVYVCACVRVCA